MMMLMMHREQNNAHAQGVNSFRGIVDRNKGELDAPNFIVADSTLQCTYHATEGEHVNFDTAFVLLQQRACTFL